MWLRSCEGGVVYGVLADGLGGDYTPGVWIEAWDVLTASNYALDKDRSRCALYRRRKTRLRTLRRSGLYQRVAAYGPCMLITT